MTPNAYWGAFIRADVTYAHYYGGKWENPPWDQHALDKFEENAGKKVSWLAMGMKGCPIQRDFNYSRGGLQLCANRGEIPFLNMETGNTPLHEIASGKHDDRYKPWFADAAAFAYPFVIGLDVEMNGRWEPWSPGVNGNTADDFIKAWQHTVDLARQEGADNISWAWVPNVDIAGTLTPFESVYPGDDYVDWVGLDGFNWGGNEWMSFRRIFHGSYATIRGLAPDKPFVISQTGCAELGGSKSEWINRMFLALPAFFPYVKALLWFDWRIWQKNAWQEWPIESSPKAQNAFKAGIASPYWLPGGTSFPLGLKVPTLL